MMSHWIIAPVVLPAIIAPLVVLMMRNDLTLQRIFGLTSTLALAAIAAALLISTSHNPPEIYRKGAPFPRAVPVPDDGHQRGLPHG
jgi:multicomponent K+:H+ antiporter subunit D